MQQREGCRNQVPKQVTRNEHGLFVICNKRESKAESKGEKVDRLVDKVKDVLL